MKFRISSANSWLDLCINLAIALLLAVGLWHVISSLGASLGLAWFASSDETVVVAGQSRLAPGVRVNATDMSKASSSSSASPS